MALADLLVTHGEGDAYVNEKEGKNYRNVHGKSILGAIPCDLVLLQRMSYHTIKSASTSKNSRQPDYGKKAQTFVNVYLTQKL